MKLAISGAIAAVILFTPGAAFAQSENPLDISLLFSNRIIKDQVPEFVLVPEKPKDPPQVEPTKVEPVVYTVIEGDNLSKIGTEFNVKWQRLWAKNTELKHPDLIYVGNQITIPLPDEVLDREIPVAVSLPVQTPGVADVRDNSAGVVRGDPGNTYDYGYCTWYVKNRRGGSLPNGLGNANTWYARARNAGMAVGPTPVPGAVGTTTRGSYGHVVYVESVNGDGTINISEMNYQGWGVTSSRTANASEFVYIY